MMPDFKRFSAIGMFADFTLRQLTAIFEKIQAKAYGKGEIILQPGSTDLGFYFVIEGTVRIYTMVEEEEVTLGVLYPGEFFGEISVIEGGAPSAIARAEEAALIYFLPRDQFYELAESSTSLAAKLWEALTRIMISRMRKTNATIQQYFGVNKALCKNPKFREFYQLCQFGS